ncbi:transmembrane protein 40 isoform X7 [Cavia porcellus]|uniref:transmembrane protein 40 isoform X7 n=2 Tax=Cavia porcellus TaxID=10141 RepID=UPI002FE04D79
MPRLQDPCSGGQGQTGVSGNAMETTAFLSQSQDSSHIYREAEDSETELQQQDGKSGLLSQELRAEYRVACMTKDALQLYRDDSGEVVPSEETGLRQRGVGPTEGAVEDSQLSRLNIKKDDEFFHFVLLCFGIGALLVSYHYYADWFMSLGVGLLTFASLETVGIYFGLVYRIHSVLRGFLPLFQKIRQLVLVGNSALIASLSLLFCAQDNGIQEDGLRPLLGGSCNGLSLTTASLRPQGQ